MNANLNLALRYPLFNCLLNYRWNLFTLEIGIIAGFIIGLAAGFIWEWIDKRNGGTN